MVKREPDKHLKLRANPHTGLGKTIAYLQNHPTNTSALAAHILQTRILPFALDKDDPQFLALALQCAEECESWARAIRLYAGLTQPEMMSMAVTPTVSATPSQPISTPTNNDHHEDKLSLKSEDVRSSELTEMEKNQRAADSDLENLGLKF